MKKIKSYPWTKQEEDWLRQSIKDHPEWSNATMYNQMKYALPYTEHTKKATASKINTLRPSRGKCKWNAKAHTTLAQQFVYGLDHESMADYFNVSVPAIVHQLHKLEKIGMIKRTPGRQVTAHERVIKHGSVTGRCITKGVIMEPTEVKQLNIDFNQRDAVQKQNKLSAQIRNIDNSVAKLMQDNCEKLIGPEIPRTATEIDIGYNNQQRMLDNLLQVANNLTQVLNNTLQLMVGK